MVDRIKQQSLVVKRSVIIAGHQTSVSLEAPFWDLFRAIAKSRGASISELAEEVDEVRMGNLSSAIRLFVLQELLERLPEDDIFQPYLDKLYRG